MSLFGHQGIEWDIATATPQDLHAVAEWAALVKSQRALVHGGELVRMERPSDPGTSVFGSRRSRPFCCALFAFVRTSTLLQSESPPMRLDGLDPSSRYVVTRLNLPGETPHDASARSGAGPTMVLGSLIMGPGLEAPHLPPEAAALFHLAKQES